MQTEALKLWAELEEESGQKLLRKHGTLNYGEPGRGETVQASRPPCSAQRHAHGYRACQCLMGIEKAL